MNLLLPSPAYKAEWEEPQSTVAMHEMEPGWVMDRLWGWGDPEPPGSTFLVFYKGLLPRETDKKSGSLFESQSAPA